MTGKWQNMGFRLFGRRPGCEWVTDRLLPYLKCDPELSDREYAAIDAHLASCPACAEEYKALSDGWDALAEILYPDESLPYIDCNAMAARIIANIREKEAFAPREPHIYEFRPARRQTTGRLRRLRPAAALAAAAILLVALPVLAYVGQQVWQQITSPQHATQDVQTAAVSNEETLPLGSDASVTTPAPPVSLPPPVSCIRPQSDTDLFAAVDKETQQRAIQAQIQAALPHTDAEYEAWARKEYPHVMALYEILTGNGLPREGESIDRETIHKRFAALVPNNLPQDVRAYLLEVANLAAQSDHPLWDGCPVNIPDWAQRLYADTPESDRPTGWRALLIYSGEIFKFDWPKSVQEPNVRPTLDGLHNAALVAGRANEPAATFRHLTRPDMPEGYLSSMTSNATLADDVLTYVATSSRLIATTESQTLAENTVTTQASIHNTRNPECAVHTRLLLLRTLFDGRKAMLTVVKERGKKTGYA